MKPEITEEFVGYIIDRVRTWLELIPEWKMSERGYEIDLNVKNGEGLNLRFCASLPNAPTALPRFSYLFNNTRVRGIDFHSHYIDYQKNPQSGWHEHIWCDETGFAERYPDEDFIHVPPDRQINYILKKWKIEYKEQFRLEFPES